MFCKFPAPEELGGFEVYQFSAIWLVYAVFHRLINELGIWRVCGKGGGQDGNSLQIKHLRETCKSGTEDYSRALETYQILSGIRVW